MSHGLKANTVRGWRKLADERDGATAPPPALADIQIELRRGVTAMKKVKQAGPERFQCI